MVKFISRRYFAFFSHCWVHRPRCTFVPRYFLAVIAVFLNCGVECAFAGHVKPELSGGTFDFSYGLAESRKCLHVPVLGDGVESLQLRKNSASEGSGGLVKSGFSINTIGDISTKNSSKDAANNFFKVVYEKFKHRPDTPFDWFWWLVILPICLMPLWVTWIFPGIYFSQGRPSIQSSNRYHRGDRS